MFSKDRFRAKYIEHGLKAADVARIMGISTATLYRKTSGESDFTRNEIQLFRAELGLSASEIAYIFLDDITFSQDERRNHERIDHL